MTEYIQALQRQLLPLTTAEQQDAVSYYQEYLEDAGITTYAAAVTELGTPQSLARKILADYSIKQTQRAAGAATPQAGAKADVKLIWVIILALLSTPVTIPLVLVIIALLIALGSVIFALAVTGVALLFTGFFGGALAVVVGLVVFWTTPWTGAFYLGLGLIALGGSWLVTEGVIWCAGKLLTVVAQFAKWAYTHWVPGTATKRGE